MVKIVKIGDLGLLLVFIVVLLIVTAIVSQLWSLSGFIGLVLIFVSVYLVFKRGGKIGVTRNDPWIIFLILGIFFFILSYTGIQIIPF